jgi:hypothetical protein
MTAALSPFEITIRVTANTFFEDSSATGNIVILFNMQRKLVQVLTSIVPMLTVDGAPINLGSVKGGNWTGSKNNDKNGEAITTFKEAAYIGGNSFFDETDFRCRHLIIPIIIHRYSIGKFNLSNYS